MNEIKPIAVRIRQAAAMLSVSERQVANLIASGELPSHKIGRSRIIPVSSLEALVASRMAAAAARAK